MLLAREQQATGREWFAVGGLATGDEGDVFAAVADGLEQVEVAGVAAAVGEDAEVFTQAVGEEGVGAGGLRDGAVVETGEA